MSEGSLLHLIWSNARCTNTNSRGLPGALVLAVLLAFGGEFGAATIAIAQGWSTDTATYLADPKPLKPDTDRMPFEQREAARRAAADELRQGFEAFMAPLAQAIRVEAEPVALAEPWGSVDMGSDNEIDPWEPTWVFTRIMRSDQETDDRVAVGDFPFQGPSPNSGRAVQARIADRGGRKPRLPCRRGRRLQAAWRRDVPERGAL